MDEALVVFLSGMGGVFCGMVFLYIAIRTVSFVTAHILKKQALDKKASG